jgi:hypothetical protein
MAKERLTPEEKLLKVIESPHRLKARPFKRRMKRAFPHLIGDFFKRVRIDFRKLKLKTVNKMLVNICVLVTGFFIWDFVRVKASLDKRFQNVTDVSDMAGFKVIGTNLFKESLDDAIAYSNEKNIFSFSKEQPSTETAVSPVENNYRLVAVIWADNPQVMVEDIKDQRTYLLSVGDKIGDFVVKEILRDGVVLEGENKEWELR